MHGPSFELQPSPTALESQARAQPQTCHKEPLFLLVLGAGRVVRLVVSLPGLSKLRPKLSSVSTM